MERNGGPMDSREQLEKHGLLWLLVGAIGFFVGQGYVTGPLAWYFGSRLKKRCAAARVHPAPTVIEVAYIVGIVSTVINVLVVGVFLLLVGFRGGMMVR